MKLAFPPSKAIFHPMRYLWGTVLPNDWLKKGEYKTSVTKAVCRNNSVFSYFCPGMTKKYIFQLSC